MHFLVPGEPLPPPESADRRGVVAVGGELVPARLRAAYYEGIFPWYEEGIPVLWHSPDPRMVLEPGSLHVPRSLRKTARRRPYDLRLDVDFDAVIRACSRVPRPDQDGTWITSDMIRAYGELHREGDAHCVAAYQDGALVGGLYGVAVGAVFCGESMFALAPDASKLAFVALVEQLERWGFELVDCQVHTDHLARFGAQEWSRARFLQALRKLRAQSVEVGRGVWRFDTPAGDSPG